MEQMEILANLGLSEHETKVYLAALELGESLTSMYIRIKDMEFEDVVDDPLIRCLFNGAFGAYQLAQLKRLLPNR